MQYPALSFCTVIESRLSSRLKIQLDLKATALFENVVQAESIGHAKQLLASTAVDVCVIGPSISEQASNSFIASVNAHSASLDCAFLVLVSKDSIGGIPQKRSGHFIQQYPCSKMQFADAIVSAVVGANKSSPWARLREQHQALLNAASAEDSATEPADALVEPPSDGESQWIPPVALPAGLPSSAPAVERRPHPSLTLAEAIAHCAPKLTRLTSGTFLFRPDGAPTKTLLKTVYETRDAFCAAAPVLDTPEIRATLETLLVEFVRDFNQVGTKEAHRRLYQGLGRIFGGRSAQ